MHKSHINFSTALLCLLVSLQLLEYTSRVAKRMRMIVSVTSDAGVYKLISSIQRTDDLAQKKPE